MSEKNRFRHSDRKECQNGVSNRISDLNVSHIYIYIVPDVMIR